MRDLKFNKTHICEEEQPAKPCQKPHQVLQLK